MKGTTSYNGFHRFAACFVETLQALELVDVAVRILDAEATVVEKADVLPLLHAELDRSAVGVHLPLLEAEADVHRVHARDERDEACAREPVGDQLALLGRKLAEVLDEEQFLAVVRADADVAVLAGPGERAAQAHV